MSELRERIAEVLFRCDWGDRRGWHQATDDFRLGYRYDADAVIAELGLRTEWGRLDPTDSGSIYDCIEDANAAIDCPGEKLRTRLVTEWVDVQQG